MKQSEFFLFNPAFRVLYFLIVSMGLYVPLHAQKKQLSPSAKVVKIAYLDPSLLRKNYRAFYDARTKLTTENDAEKKAYEKSMKALDEQTAKLLKKDSVSRDNKRIQIINDAASKRAKLSLDFEAGQSKRNDERLALISKYEKEIVLAIDKVVTEGGYTDVRPIVKGTVTQDGTNITDKVLSKLN
jgi:Skp family chaperone for outer membrane proteins